MYAQAVALTATEPKRIRHFSRHVDGLSQRRVRINRLANIDRICTHFDSQCNLASHVVDMRTNHAVAEDFAVAVRFCAAVKQQLGPALAAAVCGCMVVDLNFKMRVRFTKRFMPENY